MLANSFQHKSSIEEQLPTMARRTARSALNVQQRKKTNNMCVDESNQETNARSIPNASWLVPTRSWNLLEFQWVLRAVHLHTLTANCIPFNGIVLPICSQNQLLLVC